MSFADLPTREKLILVHDALFALVGEAPSVRDVEHLLRAAQAVIETMDGMLPPRALIVTWGAPEETATAA